MFSIAKVYSGREKTLPDFYPTWRKGTFPAAALGSCSVSSSRRKVLRDTCDAYMPGTQTNKRLRFNHDYGILPPCTHLTRTRTGLYYKKRLQLKKLQLSEEYLWKSIINRRDEN